MKINFIKIFSVFCLLIGCQSYNNYRGNCMLNENLDKFIEGETTMQDVLKACGTPSLHKDDYTWIYCGYEEEIVAFNDEKINNHQIIRMKFNQKNILISKEKLNPKTEDLQMDDEYTSLMSEAEALKHVKNVCK